MLLWEQQAWFVQFARRNGLLSKTTIMYSKIQFWKWIYADSIGWVCRKRLQLANSEQENYRKQTEIFIRYGWDLHVPLKTNSLVVKCVRQQARFFIFLFLPNQTELNDPPAGLFPLQLFPVSCCTPELQLSPEKKWPFSQSHLAIKTALYCEMQHFLHDWKRKCCKCCVIMLVPKFLTQCVCVLMLNWVLSCIAINYEPVPW